jgi:hypothetical protein
MPWMTLQAFYVLISRVTRMSGLRLLQHDQTGLENVLTLMPDKYLYAWEQGYDTNGVWNKELAAVALRNIRSIRDIEKQAFATELRERPFINNQRSPAKERPNEHRSPTKKRPTLDKCSICKATGHSARKCPTTIARCHTTPTKKVAATARPTSPVASLAVRVAGDHPGPISYHDHIPEYNHTPNSTHSRYSVVRDYALQNPISLMAYIKEECVGIVYVINF